MTLGIILALLIVVFAFIRAKHISPISIGVYDKVNQGVFSDVAMEGYDPVSYFNQQKAIEGDPEHSFKWERATWLFSSRENLDLFRQNPKQYAPQYGGYCSFAVSKGFTANIDPQAWLIDNEQLYLFAEPKFKKQFQENLTEFKEKAEDNWSTVE